MDYSGLTTDELLELLPNHLQLARNENAPAHDRWRVYNPFTQEHIEPGQKTARELLIATLTKNDLQMKDWVGA